MCYLADNKLFINILDFGGREMENDVTEKLVEKHRWLIKPIAQLYVMGQDKTFWRVARKLGLSKEDFDKRHPDIVQAEKDFRNTEKSFNRATLVGGIVGALASFIPVISERNYFPNRAWQWSAAIVSSIATGILGAIVASRPLRDKVCDHEHSFLAYRAPAIEPELAKAIEDLQNKPPPSFPCHGKAFAQTVRADPAKGQEKMFSR